MPFQTRIRRPLRRLNGVGITNVEPMQHSDRSQSDTAVESILDGLDEIRSAPTTEHATIYARLHDRLLAELDAELDADPDAVPGPGTAVPGPGHAGPRPADPHRGA
jgi:hypothetical protein